ncbi:hypothetical protein [Mesobacillus maritimus]|uniref:hypothetical protein n=1 Tax=Mesobacillus maritimus TaxID=1643336 RepID=UPI00384D2C81
MKISDDKPKIPQELFDDFENHLRTIKPRLMEEAKKNGTYIIYMDDDGDVVKEYPDGRIKKVRDENE